MATTADLQTNLQKLAESILKIVVDAKGNGLLRPEEEALFQWKLNEFEYGETGITKSQAQGQYVTKPTWFKAQITLSRSVAETAEFRTVESNLMEVYPSSGRQHLDRFAGEIIRSSLSLESAEAAQHENEDTTRKFLDELDGGLVLYKAKVALQGVTLEPVSVPLDAGVIIRQPTREDLEQPHRSIGPLGHTLPHPSAILEVELRTTRGRNTLLQAEVEKDVALLRLFNVGSAKWTSFESWSDSLLDLLGQGTLMAGGQSFALETYFIKTDHEPHLKNFWHTMSGLMPKDVYTIHSKQISHITLAFDRYSDGLLQNGIVERRIANAVMGLEALFLEESQELSYRLGLRVSKTLSTLGRNPLEVREVIQDAYTIRSAFAHGGHLTYKASKKLERKYGSTGRFLRSVLDYLRLSIVVMILSRVSKDEFVDLLDDSLLHTGKHQELQNKMADANTLLAT